MTGTTREILIIPEHLTYISEFVEVHFQNVLHSITFFCIEDISLLEHMG